MVDTSLRCDESFSETPPLMSQHDLDPHTGDSPHFLPSYKDRAILGDSRVLGNMLKLEGFYMGDPQHYRLQAEIRPHMRKVVADWMLEVCVDQQCHPDVFLLAINIMDRFLGTIQLRKKQFQLLGASAIFLASKMMEPSPIPAVTLVKYTADTYDREELLSMELLILSKLKWDLTAITAYDYLDHLLDTLPTQSTQMSSLRSQTEHLMTLCATESTFLSLPPSAVAGASIASAANKDKHKHKLGDIVNDLQRVTRTEMACLQHCIRQIESLFITPEISTRTPTSHMSSYMTSTPHHTNPSPSSSEGFFSSSSPDRTHEARSSEGFFSASSPENQIRDEDKDRETENKTPTEVFSVVAFCVT